MKPCYSLGTMPKINPQHVSGTTLTVPGLAPSLISLLQNNTLGEPLPMVGQPHFDESEESGSARVAASNIPYAEGMNIASVLANEENERREAEAKPDEGATPDAD